ncbi:3-deoxy-7-phosphoheptulonate synthase [Marinitoga sp. 1135]|uniref:Phospho-2-dehydro-3-deoxyheptonate aldolase n=1 Tax=Marinitoga piezophila (strain DSM 14283 / JCM 11233 / KA3) TaxID=443254 RepID=H2J2R6_MARPK|nr:MULTISPECIES: 3-deoxy-7-phosphoheptulonate synthase [Marinitoga]AEX84510.1 phospho-2-dehydro-3-deoxyheptonate aldolase [Marinitoga piezophila KA3]NUU94759.1 3-deoxy-7-phosphoheptulonate synthase [Marinitoga sp. 1135]NUU96688.1 3-deoxy-7-phosphoheptulonate synthase [Marinitoga sp. 1138]
MDIKIISKENILDDYKVNISEDVFFGKGYFTIIAGPCSVESKEIVEETAHFLSELEIKIMRGGVFKPRTSPYSFQGLGKKGLEYLKSASEKYNLKIITEALEEESLEIVNKCADIIQIGSRNSQNYGLLKKVGQMSKPVLLKRGFMMTIKEFLYSAEYIALEGNKNIILCERGIRTFETQTRNTLDISAVPVLKNETFLPIIIDPSHAAGRRDIIPDLIRASLAVGAMGIMVEVHPKPEKALSDGKQSLTFKEFEEVVKELRELSKAFGVEII